MSMNRVAAVVLSIGWLSLLGAGCNTIWSPFLETVGQPCSNPPYGCPSGQVCSSQTATCQPVDPNHLPDGQFLTLETSAVGMPSCSLGMQLENALFEQSGIVSCDGCQCMPVCNTQMVLSRSDQAMCSSATMQVIMNSSANVQNSACIPLNGAGSYFSSTAVVVNSAQCRPVNAAMMPTAATGTRGVLCITGDQSKPKCTMTIGNTADCPPDYPTKMQWFYDNDISGNSGCQCNCADTQGIGCSNVSVDMFVSPNFDCSKTSPVDMNCTQSPDAAYGGFRVGMPTGQCSPAVGTPRAAMPAPLPMVTTCCQRSAH